MVARCLNKWKKHKSFQKKSFYYTPNRSVSLLTSVLNFQTSITDGWRPRMSRHFCLLCNWLRSICRQLFFFIIPDPYDIYGQSRHIDVMNVAKGLKLHDLILSFLSLSRTNVGSKTFFFHNGRYGYSVTFWIWVVSELSQRHGNHKPQRFDFLIECKLSDWTCQFYFSHNENI